MIFHGSQCGVGSLRANNANFTGDQFQQNVIWSYYHRNVKWSSNMGMRSSTNS